MKKVTGRFKSLRMMMNMAKDDIPVQFCISNPMIGQLRSNDDVIRSLYVSPYNFSLKCDRLDVIDGVFCHECDRDMW